MSVRALEWTFLSEALSVESRNHAGRSTPQERRLHQHVDDLLAGRGLESPQARRLAGRETEPRHLEELTADAIGDGVDLHR